LKIYQKLGGIYPVPDIVLSHTEAGHDLYNFLPASVKDRVKLLGTKK
jgi:hypothetical protein